MNQQNLVHSASANWYTQNQTPNGVRPPQPNLNFDGKLAYSTLPEVNPTQSYNLLKINSQREPFAVQYLVNGYGGGPSPRLGTTLGT
jgi:hypothetical protein